MSIEILRGVIDDALDQRRSATEVRVRLVVVGLDERSFVVELGRAKCRSLDDTEQPTDATLWIREDDVPRLVHGWTLGGVRSAGDRAAVEALSSLLVPGGSPLSTRFPGGR